tara:strand:+ start:99 stop:845 length:747 start_codon:yes stop_codon:yes gene_type:complete
MAVSVDTVYQKVLALANKEQRGYITPQEFNLFADHAQKEIFEQYFYDLNQFRRIPGNDTEYSDMVKNLEEKISLFEVYGHEVLDNGYGLVDLTNDISNLYRIGEVRVIYLGKGFSTAEEAQIKDLDIYSNKGLTGATIKRPRYTRYNKEGVSTLHLYPNSGSGNTEATIDKVRISYIKKPAKPQWGYVVINNKPLYNVSSSIGFDLHPSEESELVYRILALAGVAIEKPQLTQIAGNATASQIQQEKQ